MNTPRKGADLLAIGFGTTLVIWSLLYVAAMPPGSRGLWMVIMACGAVALFAAGYAAGRLAGRGPGGGAALGVVITAVNLLVLGSLMAGDATGDGRRASWWILGLLVAAVVLGACGAAVGRRAARERPVDWISALAWVTAAATLLMLVSGGVVTGLEAGLAVEGWLIAEGHFLVLFPITLMQRNVDTFVEHAHRLWGLLVGLSTIVLMVQVWMADRRRWVRWLAIGLFLAVATQGWLGGGRVIEQSVTLAIVHGVFAQVILASMVLLAMATTAAWRADTPPEPVAAAPTDRMLGVIMIAMILLQVTLGTVFRHIQPVPGTPRGALIGMLHGHSFVGSALVLALVLLTGVRAWGIYTTQPIIKRLGTALVHVVGLQVALGIAAFIVVPKGPRAEGDAITTLEVGITSAHQVVGALLLATAVSLAAWQRRLTV